MKTIEFDQANFDSIMEIAKRENFPEALRVLKKFTNGKISITQEEAQTIVDVLAYEISRVCLRYPYNEDDEGYEENDEWGDVVNSVYPSTLALLTPHFELNE